MNNKFLQISKYYFQISIAFSIRKPKANGRWKANWKSHLDIEGVNWVQVQQQIRDKITNPLDFVVTLLYTVFRNDTLD